mmetsp:Transcript_20671/g.45152  ORF Transcript_20671/g.45152 Transcript_20671/m.45152 type:complete len:325 (-) Transcript_20671:68-1042(-)
MSLRGRYVIDRIKSAVSHRFSLPCPPYGMPSYWEGVYKKLGPSDVYEWGSISLQDVMKHRYDAALYAREVQKFGYNQQAESTILDGGVEMDTGGQSKERQYIETTFGECIGVHPEDHSGRKILLLGCGNSKFGEDMLSSGGWTGPIIQADVSQRVVTTMTERCGAYIADGTMEVVQDDATSLTAFEDDSIDAAVDKGMMDALFCANRPDQLMEIMKNVNRVLVPGGIYCVFSFSRPEYMLEQVLDKGNVDTSSSTDVGHTMVKKKRRRSDNVNKKLWEDVQVRALDSILIYRFVKASGDEETSGESHARKMERQKRQRMQRRKQ